MSPTLARRAVPVAVMMIMFVGLLGASVTPARAAGPVDPQAVQQFIDAYRQRHGLPGIAVAVVKDGELVHEAGSGPDGADISARTPMAIGSTTKPVTAFAVLQLVDSGDIALDDPVVQHLAEFQLSDPRGASITVRQLLSHTSGLPNPTLVPPADSPAERMTQLRDIALAADPGTQYGYSNFNYHVAARLIEVVSGEGYADYLAGHVFEPLGMSDSVAAVTKSDRPGLTDGHVMAYGLPLRLPEMKAMNAGAGDIISTAHDLGLWLAMYQRGGTAPDGTRLLSTELIEESLVPQPGAGRNSLGWQHTQTSEPARVGKDGSLTRFSSRIDLVPSSGYGVVVLLNSYTPTIKHQFEISSGIIALTEGQPADLGAPVSTIIDLVVGAITLAAAALLVRGVVRARSWAARRRNHPGWRFALRLLPQLVMPLAAITLFGVLPLVGNNTATALDAFGLWPAATILVLVAGIGGAVLVGARIRWRVGGAGATSSASTDATD